jgi:Ca2+-binding EF-hand superfamily protein
MNLDRALFAVYDTDSDGRITQTEFTERYRTLVSRGGAFAPPVEKLAAHRAPRRTPEDLMAAFDQDRDGALDHHDVQRALTDYGAQGVDAEKILASLDADKSSRIELAEAQALLDVLAPPTKTEGRKKVTSIEALFDQPDPRSSSTDSPAQAPRLRGPLSTFRRLDFDHSGGVSIEDLEALQRPLLIPVRAAAVIATLDLDGDGEVSRRELAVAMR